MKERKEKKKKEEKRNTILFMSGKIQGTFFQIG